MAKDGPGISTPGGGETGDLTIGAGRGGGDWLPPGPSMPNAITPKPIAAIADAIIATLRRPASRLRMASLASENRLRTRTNASPTRSLAFWKVSRTR